MKMTIPLLIIGAGPYGLAMAAYCRHIGLDHLLLGQPMAFWKSNMPRGMYLRSRSDWHLDPLETATLECYERNRKLRSEEIEPISLELYLDYADWFQTQREIIADQRLVRRLDMVDASGSRFLAVLDDGQAVIATNVVVTAGYGACAHIPDDLAHTIPQARFCHTSDFVDLRSLAGRSCLIIGGRQSAFEWAALAAESGAAEVHVSHRHATPKFAHADWRWINPLLAQIENDIGWHQNLTMAEKEQIKQRMWSIGRLQLESWLSPRIDKKNVRVWPYSRVSSVREMADGRLDVALDIGVLMSVDTIISATGYKMDVNRVPFLASGNILHRLRQNNGYPVLDGRFQSNISGLYFSNKFAAQDFGNFFDFTVGVRLAARMIGRAVSECVTQQSSLRADHARSIAQHPTPFVAT